MKTRWEIRVSISEGIPKTYPKIQGKPRREILTKYEGICVYVLHGHNARGLKSARETRSFRDTVVSCRNERGEPDGRPEIVNLYYGNSCIAPRFSPHRCQLRSGVRCPSRYVRGRLIRYAHGKAGPLPRDAQLSRARTSPGSGSGVAAATGERIYKPKRAAFFTAAVPRSFVSSRISRQRASTR